MGKTSISLISEDEAHHLSLRQQILDSTMTNVIYQTLSPADQEAVHQELFDLHAQPITTPVALSALEFTIFGLAKIFFKTQSGEVLTDQEAAFISRFQHFIEQHEINLNPDDWYIPYAENGMLDAKQNRAEYRQKKIDITGKF